MILKTFTLACFFILAQISCTPVIYQMAQSPVEKAAPVNLKKYTLQKLFVVFNFSRNVGENLIITSSLKQVLKEGNFKSDTLTIDPLSFLTPADIENKINNFNPDAIIVVSPLQNFVGRTKSGYHVSSLNYLIEIRKDYKSMAFKICTVSFKISEFYNSSLINETITAIREFLSH